MKNGKRENGNSAELSIKSEIFGIIFLFLSILLIFSLVSYSPFDPSFFHSTMNSMVENYGGKIGSEVSAFLFVMFGYASYVLIIYFLFITAYFFLKQKNKEFLYKKFRIYSAADLPLRSFVEYKTIHIDRFSRSLRPVV